MESKACEWCGTPINLMRGHARFCTPAHRVATHRDAKRDHIPRSLRNLNRWVRWRTAIRASGPTKMPVNLAGFAVNATDPASWSSHRDAEKSTSGVGLGFVLNGDGLACIDLDDVLNGEHLDERAKALLAEVKPFYVEVSPSGNGIHAWVHGGSPNGRKVFSRPDGLKVEWYTDKRFLCMTGNRLQEVTWKSPPASVNAA